MNHSLTSVESATLKSKRRIIEEYVNDPLKINQNNITVCIDGEKKKEKFEQPQLWKFDMDQQ